VAMALFALLVPSFRTFRASRVAGVGPDPAG
jgi:hypothetical protein